MGGQPRGPRGPQGPQGPQGPPGTPAPPPDRTGVDDQHGAPATAAGAPPAPETPVSPGNWGAGMIPIWGLGGTRVNDPHASPPDPSPGTTPAAPAAPAGVTIAIPNLPPPTKPPAYPAMADPGNKPGFKLVTAGSEYGYIGGDSSRIVVGDRRVIVGGIDVTHVSGARTKQVGGHAGN